MISNTPTVQAAIVRQAAMRRVQSLIGNLRRACSEAGGDYREVRNVPLGTPGKTPEFHIAIWPPN